MRGRVLLMAVTAVAVVLAGAAAVDWVVSQRRTAYEQALGTVPASALRVSFTDWSLVRGELGRHADDEELLRLAYDQDLSRTSALGNSAVALRRHLGVSPLDAEWEVYGQGRDGAVAVLKVAEGTDFADIRRRLQALGFGEPPSRTGAWTGTPELLTRIDIELTPVETNVVLLEDERLVLFSDDAVHAEKAADVATGGRRSLRDSADVERLATVAGTPVSALLWASDHACEALSMATADPTDQQEAAELVRRAGGVSPLAGLVMAKPPSGDLTVGMLFETDDQASANLQPRTDLASGDAPGQGGTFPDRFRITSAEADGPMVTLRLRPQPGQEALLSDLSGGPLLFAGC